MSNDTHFIDTLSIYVEDQRIEGIGEGTESFWELKGKVRAYRDVMAMSFEEGIRRDSFIEMWNKAVEMVDKGIMDSVRWAMVPTGGDYAVMIFKITNS